MFVALTGASIETRCTFSGPSRMAVFSIKGSLVGTGWTDTDFVDVVRHVNGSLYDNGNIPELTYSESESKRK